MNYVQEKEFEQKIGHQPSQSELSEERTRLVKEIKKYCNHSGYSDVEPYEVVRVISEQTVEIRKMRTVQTKFPQEFHSGGFVGHYADNRSGQEYDYFSDESYPIERVRWSKVNNRWQQGNYGKFYMSDTPYKHYDYNF